MVKKGPEFWLCEESALAESARGLIEAHKLAKKNKSVDDLITVSMAWAELSGRLGPDKQPDQPIKMFGFAGVEVKDGNEGKNEPGLHP